MHILSFPTELTRAVFDYACLPSRRYYKTKLSGLDGTKELVDREEGQELAISHVCQSWREISVHYPDLWVAFNHLSKYSQYHVIERFTTYAERAQSNLLDISIDVSGVNVMDLVFNVIKSHSQRLRCLSLLIHPSFDFYSYQASDDVPCGPSAYGNLKILHVSSAAYHPVYPQWFKHLIQDAISAPNMVSLQMDHCLIVRSGIGATSCKNSLCNLEITYGARIYQDTKLLLQVLSNFPNLITLSITGAFEDTLSLDPFKLVVLSRLKYYRCGSTHFAAFAMGRYFRAPQLELMILRGIEDLITWQDQDSESFPRLRTLVLIDCDKLIVDGRYTSLVELTRRIPHLIVFHTELTPFWFLEHLAPNAWPNLEQITLRQLNATKYEVMEEWDINPEESIPAFVKMMVRRKKGLLHTSLNLRMGANLARQFVDAAPDLWGELEAAVAMIEIVPDSVWPDDHSTKFHFPWPPLDDVDFQQSLSDTSRFTIW